MSRTKMKRLTSPKKKDKNSHPRVGKNYQAEIPFPTSNIDESDGRSDKFSFGHDKYLVPIVWEKTGFEKNISSPLPGVKRETWTELEKDTFVLALYIFGKDLDLAKKFVGSKEMADIQSFYYGEFYNSREYRNWHESPKKEKKKKTMRKKKPRGEKIFSGWRHEKLLNRLRALISDEFQGMLLMASSNFENKVQKYEDYVFTLKNLVGIEALVEAIGIGRGKGLDLSENPRRRPMTPDKLMIANGGKKLSRKLSETKKTSKRKSQHNNSHSVSAATITVVDTSLVNKKKRKLVELRSLPEASSASSSSVETEEEEVKETKLVGLDLNAAYVPSDQEEDGIENNNKALIDLNMAYVPSDNSEEKELTEETNNDDSKAVEESSTSEVSRKSLRKRPMTKRALESLENDILSKRGK